MSHFLIILLLTCTVCGTSYGQKPPPQKQKPISKIDPKEPINSDLTDTVYIDSILKISGDSILVIIDSLMKDTAFLMTLGDSALWDVGEFVSTAYKVKIPGKLDGWTKDYERIFNLAQIDTLNSIISKFEAETAIEIAIVTIDSSLTTAEDFDSLVLAIHNHWGVGKKVKSNGIVIGVSAGLKKIRISNGYGIEAKLSDNETKKIIDDTIIPHFKRGNIFEGVRRGLLAIFHSLQ